MEDESIDRTRKPRRKSRTTQVKRKTSRIYELVLAAFNATKYGNIEDLLLIAKSFQTEEEYNLFINTKDKEGNTLILKCIHSAAARKPEPGGSFIDCLNFLVSAGVNVNSQDNLSRTALHWIVLYGRLDFLDVLLAAGGNLLIPDSNGLNPLHLAIGIKSEKLRDSFAEYICSCAPKELLEAADGNGRNPLFLALTVNAVKSFEKLLIAKVNPDCCGSDGRKIIIHAIEKGHGRFIELLLKYGASLTTSDPEGFSVVHLAACQENPDSIFVFTEVLNKTLLNVKDNLGRTPLMYACLMGFDKNVELLLSQKIWILDQDNDGKTALHHTISNTHCGCVELLCMENSKIAHTCDHEGHTPAHDAVITGNLPILNCLLRHGCDVKLKDYSGCTAIHWAVAYGTLNCFERLLECNVPLDEVDNHGATPLHYGCQKETDERLANVRSEILQMLLHRGVKLTQTDAEGRRPIHWSSTSGNTAAIKVLLDHGDNVNAVTSQEKMAPLHICAVQGHQDTVEYLLNQDGININVQDGEKCSPLFYACSSGHSNVAEILLQAGADPNLCNVAGEGPCHGAAMNGSVECLKLLFISGGNLSLINNQKDTPLHDAASAGKKDAVRFLLENGCQPTVRNTTGATPLHYSVAEGYINITKILLEKGAFVNALVTTNETDFVTPLDIALGSLDHEQIQLLQKFGAKTGHCIVDSSALVIQHRWKIFKRRQSAANWVYKSNMNDNMSNYNEVDLKPVTHDARKEPNLDKKAERLIIGNIESDECRIIGVGERNSECRKVGIGEGDSAVNLSNVKEDDVINNSLNQVPEDRGRIVRQSIESISCFKASVAERIKSNKLEFKRSDDLMTNAENVMNQLQDLLHESRVIANSKEFKLLVNFKNKKATKRTPAVCNLPRLPSR